MQSKKIGNNTVHPIGIGTWLMGGDIYLENKTTYALYGDEQKYIDAIKYSVEKGQNHIDTAQMYGAGHTEEIVGQAVADLDREKLFIASKIWRSHATRLAVPHAIHGMLQRMNTSYLDLVYIHASFPETEMSGYIAGLNDSVEQGLIRSIGVSNFTLEQLKQAVKLSTHPISAIQNHFNLLHKSEFDKDLQTYCQKNDIAMVAYRPIARKLLADKCTNQVVLDMAAKYKKTPSQIALNWLLSIENMIAIPKAANKKHIDENLGALDFQLSPADIKILNSIPDEA